MSENLASAPSGAQIVEACAENPPWPVATHWRALVPVDNEGRSAEWVLKRVKAVPLSSRTERALLAAIADDDGRAVLEAASKPGEHHIAAAVIAALRLAGSYPERAVRFLEWMRSVPTDPRHLRFIRRYLPSLEVLVRLTPTLPAAMALSTTSLGLLHVELLRASGSLDEAAAVLGSLPSGPEVALASASLRLEQGDVDGSLSFSKDRPIFDGVTAGLAIEHAKVELDQGQAAKALEILGKVLDVRPLAMPVTHDALAVRAGAQRAMGLDVEADLTEASFITAPNDSDDDRQSESVPSTEAPQAPLFGRSVADALDDAWARVRRQTAIPSETISLGSGGDDHYVDDAIALIEIEQYDSAETLLLHLMDAADDAIDRGEGFDDTYFILLAGMFAKRTMTPEEIATLERLRTSHGRAGTQVPEAVTNRLLSARSEIENLAT